MELSETITLGGKRYNLIPLPEGIRPGDPELKKGIQLKSARQRNALTAWEKQHNNTTLQPNPESTSIPDWAHRHYSAPSEDPFRGSIYLFNVLVALEWIPTANDLQGLRWGFQQASNFLFDVTDGWMAFEQVVIGGPDLMNAADIQIMASNRLHPRSWVNSIHQDEEQQPIRLGRGLWNDRQQFAIPWEEPEAYRIIIHEWCHYALGLVDEYPSTPKAVQRHGTNFSVVIPEIKPGEESIMASTEGVSELMTAQWNTISSGYNGVSKEHNSRSGPQQFPDDLPRFLIADVQNGLVDIDKGLDPPAFGSYIATTDEEIQKQEAAFAYTWIYLVRGGSDSQQVTRIIAQGTLDSRWRTNTSTSGFRLLGAEANDTVVVISSPPDRTPLVLQAKIGCDGKVGEWQNVTPSVFPIIDVLPDTESRNHIHVRVSHSGDKQIDKIYIAPLGSESVIPLDLDKGRQGETHWVSSAVPVSTLDGHVLVRNTDNTIAITTFSQGGGPPFHSPGPANPITAGSSDGNAMLFFYDKTLPEVQNNKETADAKEQLDKYAHTKVITTFVHSRQMNGLPVGVQSASYAFSIASNQQLPRDIYPTLVLYYNLLPARDKLNDLNDVALFVCKQNEQGQWKPLDVTVSPLGSPFTAIPLWLSEDQSLSHVLKQPGGALIADTQEAGLRVEYYMVGWSYRKPQVTSQEMNAAADEQGQFGS